MTDVPDNSPAGAGLDLLPLVPAAQTDYNELLYAHLLDADGNRLTYTHFTAKVNWNSMIEITFNRSVFIKANKVTDSSIYSSIKWYAEPLIGLDLGSAYHPLG